MPTAECVRQLWCPFEARINPAVDEAHAHSRAWARACGLVGGEAALRRFDAAQFAWLTARAYPTAPVHELVLVAQWNVWLFVHDDGCDVDDRGRALIEPLQRLHGLHRVLRGGTADATSSVAARALAELLPRILAPAPAPWREHFVATVDAYLAACAWEARNRANGRVPTLDDYVRMRRDTGAVRTSIAMIERCEGLVLPADVRAHPVVEALCKACNDVVCWANDIVSLRKELASGDVHNLVAVIAHGRGDHDHDAAIATATAMHDARVAEFIALADDVPHFGGDVDHRVARFVDTLRAWMRGNLDWALTSGRYHGGG